MKLAHETFGQGDGVAVVLLHGFPLDRRVMREVGARLGAGGRAEGRRVVVVDLPGFGESPDGAGATMEEIAGELRAFLEGEGLVPCVLGGLSMGGYVGLAYHRKYGADLRGLVLVDTKASADTAEAKGNRDRMVEVAEREGSSAIAKLMFPKMLGGGAGEEVRKKLMEVMEGCRAGTIVRALRAMRDRPDYTEDLRSSEVPVLVVMGEEDVITPAEGGRVLAGVAKRGRFVGVAGAGHMAPLEKPEAVAEAIEGFLKELGV